MTIEKTNITQTLYKISDFLSWQKNNTLELSPSFQRRPVWSPSAKSFLIDTIVRGFPIPILFIREQTDLNTLEPKRQVVDGQQRLRTVLSYIDPKCLKDFKYARDFFQVKKTHNLELYGKNFDELPSEFRQRILDYQFSVYILPSSVDDKQILQIFARMNATGVKLNAQELRNANFTGEFKQTMYTLAYEQLARWREWEIFSENDIARMNEVEMTSDFTFLMFNGISTKSQSVLDKLYKDYEEEFKERKIIMVRFQTVMDSIDDILGSDLKTLEFRRKTLFYSLFALIYDFHYGLGSNLVSVKKKPLPLNLHKTILSINKLLEAKKIPDKVAQSLTRRTSLITSRQDIFKYLKGKCTNV